MMQYKFSKTEQQTARNVSLFSFLSDYDPHRFSVSDRGYLLDANDPNWVGDIRKNWWYNNEKNAVHKNGNIIDFMMYYENYNFPETMQILLAYANGEDWKQHLRNNRNNAGFTPVDYDENDLPFN